MNKTTQPWQCTKCGACCRIVGHSIKELDRGDGGCKHLGNDNLCTIYAQRPEICRVTIKNENILKLACAWSVEMVERKNKGLAIDIPKEGVLIC